MHLVDWSFRAGKSTLANLLEQHLHEQGYHTYVLYGDNVRRVAQVARLMVDAGLIVVVSLISPLKKDRALARSLFAPDEFVEVFVDTPLMACEQRDVKGLYAKARQGNLKHFTGISSPYEPPEAPELRLLCDQISPQEAALPLVRTLILTERCSI